MTIYLFENNAETTLAEAVGTGDTSFDVADGSGFPSPGTGEAFYIYVEEGSTAEWMLVAGRSSNTFSSITRSGSPQSFSIGASVMLALNNTILSSFFQKGTNREVSTSPDGSLAASYFGEEVYDTVAQIWYKHCTGTTWKALNS